MLLSADSSALLLARVQEIELNKAHWSAIFEPYLFFESYKNYLQVDIIAADVNDLRAWRGWVESRLRQLTLMVYIPLIKLWLLYWKIFGQLMICACIKEN